MERLGRGVAGVVLSEVCCGDTDLCQVWKSKNKSGSQRLLFRLSAAISILQFLFYPTVPTPGATGVPLLYVLKKKLSFVNLNHQKQFHLQTYTLKFYDFIFSQETMKVL